MAKKKTVKKEVLDKKTVDVVNVEETPTEVVEVVEEVVQNEVVEVVEKNIAPIVEELIEEEVILQEEVVELKEEVQPQEDEVKPQTETNQKVEKKENKKNIAPLIFGYVWNGQEFD